MPATRRKRTSPACRRRIGHDQFDGSADKHLGCRPLWTSITSPTRPMPSEKPTLASKPSPPPSKPPPAHLGRPPFHAKHATPLPHHPTIPTATPRVHQKDASSGSKQGMAHGEQGPAALKEPASIVATASMAVRPASSMCRTASMRLHWPPSAGSIGSSAATHSGVPSSRATMVSESTWTRQRWSPTRW